MDHKRLRLHCIVQLLELCKPLPGSMLDDQGVPSGWPNAGHANARSGLKLGRILLNLLFGVLTVHLQAGHTGGLGGELVSGLVQSRLGLIQAEFITQPRRPRNFQPCFEELSPRW